MLRNLKTLGLVLVTVCATGVMASSAAAVTDSFTTSGGGTALLTGVSHDNAFTITNPSPVKFECTTAKLAGTIVNGSSEMTVDKEYSGLINATPHSTKCSSSIGEVTVDMNGCDYRLTGSTTGMDGGQTDATVWIECPSEPIKITGPSGVVVTIPGQTPKEGGVTYINLPNHSGGAAIKITTTVTGITYSCHPTFICTLAAIPHHADNLDSTGTMTVTGYADSDGLPTPVTEGARLGIAVS